MKLTQNLEANLNRELSDLTKRIEQTLNHLTEQKTAILRLVDLLPQFETIESPIITTAQVMFGQLQIFVKVPAFLANESSDLLDILEALEEITGTDLRSDDHPELGFRTYSNAFVKVFATPTDEGTCKRVVIGSRKVMRPTTVDVEVEEFIHKFQC